MQSVAVPADVPALAHGRKATWFELFFDLVFVVAVAQLSGAYAHHFDWAGAAGSAFLLLAMWWCWLGHTFHATRFDQERRDQRVLGLAQILVVAGMGFGVTDAFGERSGAFGRRRWPQPAAVGLWPRADLRRRVLPGRGHRGHGGNGALDGGAVAALRGGHRAGSVRPSVAEGGVTPSQDKARRLNGPAPSMPCWHRSPGTAQRS